MSSHPHPKQIQNSTTKQACFIISCLAPAVSALLYFVRVCTLFALLWSVFEEQNVFGLKTRVSLFTTIFTITQNHTQMIS